MFFFLNQVSGLGKSIWKRMVNEWIQMATHAIAASMYAGDQSGLSIVCVASWKLFVKITRPTVETNKSKLGWIKKQVRGDLLLFCPANALVIGLSMVLKQVTRGKDDDEGTFFCQKHTVETGRKSQLINPHSTQNCLKSHPVMHIIITGHLLRFQFQLLSLRAFNSSNRYHQDRTFYQMFHTRLMLVATGAAQPNPIDFRPRQWP